MCCAITCARCLASLVSKTGSGGFQFLHVSSRTEYPRLEFQKRPTKDPSPKPQALNHISQALQPPCPTDQFIPVANSCVSRPVLLRHTTSITRRSPGKLPTLNKPLGTEEMTQNAHMNSHKILIYVLKQFTPNVHLERNNIF